MAGRNIIPYRFNPRGVVDALDGGQIPEGGLLKATNVVFDPSNPFTFECRPAAIKKSLPPAGFTKGAVSVSYVVGDVCYGLVASTRNAGRDEPFAYNLATDTLLTVSGTISAATTPSSSGTSGTWVPPTMALVGVLLYVTHTGFPGGAVMFGWFDTTNPAAPVWNAGNTGTTPLPAIPKAVAQFNNRAWFAVGNAAYFTDALTTNITSGTQILVIGDSIGITALSPQPLITTVQGIIQSLAAFKPNVVALITGDAVDGTLAINIISSSVGCSSPRTVSPTPRGLKFMAVDGIRLLGQDGVIGEPNEDLKIPFVYALTPSRASACYNNGIYRITVQNGRVNGNPFEEYWFDESQNGWTGPHTLTQDMASPYGSTFVVFNSSITPYLFISDVDQSGASSFNENDDDLAFFLRTCPLPDNGGLYENSAVLSVIDMQLPNDGTEYTMEATDVNHGIISTAKIISPIGYTWGGTTWGEGEWTAASYGMERYNIPWDKPLVFSRMVFNSYGKSSGGLKIGKLTIGYQSLKYVRAL